jgi:Sulfotransferase domain
MKLSRRSLKQAINSRLKKAIPFLATEPSDELHSTMTPRQPSIDDLYLVSFPKSGSTWLAFMLGNVNLLMSGIDRRTTFFGLHDAIPDIHISRDIPPSTRSFPGFRMIKCHSSYNPEYHKVILLVRNPLEVMASYYKYMAEQGIYRHDIATFVEHRAYGINAWASHTLGWLDGVHPDFSYCSLCLIKYEELRSDPIAVLREIYLLLGYELPNDILTKAVERAAFASMQADEDRLNARHPSRRQFEFVRRGSGVGPRVSINPELTARIGKTAQPILDRLGYS